MYLSMKVWNWKIRFCGPSMVFTNVMNPRSEFPQKGSEFYHRTLVKKSASIGANATIICGHTIGKYAFVAAGKCCY